MFEEKVESSQPSTGIGESSAALAIVTRNAQNEFLASRERQLSTPFLPHVELAGAETAQRCGSDWRCAERAIGT